VFMNVPPHISVTITAVTSYFMSAALMPEKSGCEFTHFFVFVLRCLGFALASVVSCA
jgi:hypothetical protein